jgi:cytochrome c peroxidase
LASQLLSSFMGVCHSSLQFCRAVLRKLVRQLLVPIAFLIPEMTVNRDRRTLFAFVALASFLGALCSFRTAASSRSGSIIPNLYPYQDSAGVVATYNLGGNINTATPFFQSLGTNGRSCSTCHVPAQAYGLSAVGVQSRYTTSSGTDPIFAAVDGTNCPSSPLGSQSSFSLLMNYGLIRFYMPIPANAQFTISVVSDPFGCAVTTDPESGRPAYAVYRRPLQPSNVAFLSSLMFDGRETISPLDNSLSFSANLAADLTQQATDAVLYHEQATSAPTSAQLSQIISLELGLFSAQTDNSYVGSLTSNSATGGPSDLSKQAYYPAANDAFGGDPTGAPFNPSVFNLYTSWVGGLDTGISPAKTRVLAGEVIFNTLPFTITNVRGINDNPALGSPASFTGTCSTCHDTPNAGNHSVDLPFDIGVSHAAAYESDPNIANALTQLSPPSLPIYLISGCPDPFNPSESASFYTSDPAKALTTGQCSDFDRGKVPILRGLAARAPYFHNGSAATLQQVVNFYNQRFQINLTASEQFELIAFLNSL